MKCLNVMDDYPDEYWFEYSHSHLESTDFNCGERLNTNENIIFTLSQEIEEAYLLSYDWYQSVGPDFISPRLAELLSKDAQFQSNVQLIDASIHINNHVYQGFKAINVLTEHACIDMAQSIVEEEPLFDDAPLFFEHIVLNENTDENFCITMAKETSGVMVVSDDFMRFLLENKVKGIEFE